MLAVIRTGLLSLPSFGFMRRDLRLAPSNCPVQDIGHERAEKRAVVRYGEIARGELVHGAARHR